MKLGGGAGIRTLDASFSSHTPLAGEPLQPLGHASKPARHSSTTCDNSGRDIQAEGALSKPNALCNARTASSMYLSSISTEVLISLVLII